ncbi:MAG: gliding motility protein GldM [Bacteroidetes bacterium]|nr:gliding motility protein GldM [Bacteroidota bacterium]
MAGGGKETPRQKMIGLMYLVLMALLAMNVSKDILSAFVIVNEGLETTNANFGKNTQRMMKAFEEAKASTPQAVPYYNKAVEAHKMTDELFTYIEALKQHVMHHTAEAGTDSVMHLRYVDAKDNYDAPTHLMVGSDETKPATGEFTATELRGKMEGVRDKLLKMLDDMQKNKATQFLPNEYEQMKEKIKYSLTPDTHGATEDGTPISWEVLNFYHLPLAGVITNLTKMQSDVKNLDAEIMSNFSGAAGKMMVKFDKLAAKVVAPSSYILSGQKYTSDIFISAGSSDFKEENMQVIVNPTSYDTIKGTVTGGTNVPLADGMGKYEVSTGGQGEQKYNGVIRLKQPTGEFKLYPFEQNYMVAQQAVAVSADQMNVFYVGVPNPVSVSAAGVSPTDMIVSPSGGGVRSTPKGPGKFEYSFSSPGECTISVSAKQKDGSVKSQGSVKFRVKPLPPPVANVGGKTGSVDMKKSEISVIGGVGANAPGFDFKANFVVLSFDVTASVKGATKFTSCQGNNMSSDARSILNQVGVGSKIFIDNIKVKAPDGSIKTGVPGITIKVKG